MSIAAFALHATLAIAGIDQYQHVGGANHFDLLNHPAIYEQMRRWLSSRKALPAAAA